MAARCTAVAVGYARLALTAKTTAAGVARLAGITAAIGATGVSAIAGTTGSARVAGMTETMSATKIATLETIVHSEVVATATG